MKTEKSKKYDIVKIVIAAVALCIVMAIMFSMYNSIIPAKLAELEEEGDMENTMWLIKYGSYAVPVIVLAVILSLCYRKKGHYIPVISQREKGIVMIIVAAFTFLVILPYAIASSPDWQLPAANGEEEIKTLFETTAAWIFAQIIPFAIVITYHFIRASSEEKELECGE